MIEGAGSHVSCGQRGGGSDWQVTRDDSPHYCQSPACVSLLSAAAVTGERQCVISVLAELARCTHAPRSMNLKLTGQKLRVRNRPVHCHCAVIVEL